MDDRRAQPAIPVMRPRLPRADALAPFLAEIDKTQRYTNFGPLVDRLERQLAELLEASGTVCTSSATLALELCLAALELPRNSLVALPALNFPAAAHAILNNGHVPVFCDVDPVTGLMMVEHVHAAIDGRTLGAIMPSSLNGCGYPADYWDEVARSLGVPVILDAAGSIGFQPAGCLTITVFSLHATKPLAAGEGGFIVSEDDCFREAVRSMSNFGFQGSKATLRGTNAKMSEYHAAVGLASLQGWPARKDSLQRLFEMYRAVLRESGVDIRIVNRSGIAGILAAEFGADCRDKARQALALAGVETRGWYQPPLTQHPRFAGCLQAADLSATDALHDRLLGLPYGLHLDQAALDLIAGTLGQPG